MLRRRAQRDLRLNDRYPHLRLGSNSAIPVFYTCYVWLISSLAGNAGKRQDRRAGAGPVVAGRDHGQDAKTSAAPRQAYVLMESWWLSRGFYLVSDGTPKPYREQGTLTGLVEPERAARDDEGVPGGGCVGDLGSIDIVLGEIRSGVGAALPAPQDRQKPRRSRLLNSASNCTP